MGQERFAMIAVAMSGLLWGIYWMPLRALEDAGIHGIWAVSLFNILPLMLLVPVAILRNAQIRAAGLPLHIAGIMSGTALVLYGSSLLFTDVVRALLFFYLTPIWSTLLGRLVLKETITPSRWGTIALGLLGMLCILRFEGDFSISMNLGDWMGLGSGLLWAMSAVYIKSSKDTNGLDFTLSFFLWGSLASLLLAYMTMDQLGAGPDFAAILSVLVWLVPVALFLVIPASTAIIWGATIISPGLLSILFMTEISAGAITAAIWAGEPFGTREVLGVVLISMAGIFEPAVTRVRARRSRRT